MNIKFTRYLILINFFVFYTVSATEGSEPEVVATGIYALCLTDKVSKFASDQGCHQYYKKEDELCSDPEGKICTTKSREELCIKTGQSPDVNIPFTKWGSGEGTFTDAKSCLKACNSKSTINFGGTCHGLVIK